VQLILVLSDQLLSIVRAVEVLSLRVLSRSSVVSSDNLHIRYVLNEKFRHVQSG
jgi:hypothetical protein